MLRSLLKAQDAPGVLIPAIERYLLKRNQEDDDRDYEVFHPSDLSLSGFCVRRWTYFVDHPEVRKSARALVPHIRRTFDIGADIHRRYQTYLSDILFGAWVCSAHESFAIGMMPKQPCGDYVPGERACDWRYDEWAVSADDYLLSGMTDGVVLPYGPDGPKWGVELKTIRPEAFAQLRGPKVEHVRQVWLYLWAQTRRRHERAMQLRAMGLMEAAEIVERPFAGYLILYINKGEQDGADLKEYAVTWSDEGKEWVERRLDDMLRGKAWYDAWGSGQPATRPQGICASPEDTPARRCPFVKECFGR